MQIVIDASGRVLGATGEAAPGVFPDPDLAGEDEYATVCERHGEHAVLLGRALRAVLNGESAEQRLEPVPLPDGSVLSVEVRKLHPHGALVSVVPGMSLPDRALRFGPSQPPLSLLLERLPLCSILLDADFRVSYWNRAAEELFGYRLAEVVGRAPFEFMVAPEYAGFVQELVKSIARGELDEPSLGENVTRDGRKLLAEWTNIRLFAQDGSFGGLLAVCLDVTERTRMHQALEHSEQRYRSLVECLPDALLVTRGSTLTFANTAAVQLFRASSSRDLVGKAVTDLLHPDHHDLVSPTGDVLGASSPRRVRLLGPEERLIPAEFVAVPLADEPGGPGSLILLRDLSVHEALEQELHQKQKLEIVGRLAGGIAHDFNNVLSVIMAACALLSSRRLDQSRAREEIRFIQEAAESAAALTRQLLAFARRQTIQPQVFNLNELLRSTELLVRRLLGEDIELTMESAGDLRLVRADPRQIEQVILNLTTNAAAAMPDGGHLTITTRNATLTARSGAGGTTRKPGRYAELVVTDTGHGMSPETLERIFEPFFTTKEKGAGLGLATCYGIVEQAGGFLHVESEPGAGTVFHVYLPESPTPAPATDPVEPSAWEREGSATILVVEDNPALRIMTARILEQAGYRVLQAGNGNDALRLSSTFAGEIDLLLADVVMPGLSGPELAPKLRGARSAMAVLFMSGYADDAATREALSVDSLIHKPFTPRVLLESVRRVLEAPR